MSVLIKGIPLAGYEISIVKDGERYRARVDGIWCEVEEIKAPHGRLIDADKLDIHDISPVDGFCVMGVTEEDIDLADTAIEAED